MFNRIFKPILQNSKLNREKFVKHKKVFVENLLKNKQQNHSKIITRKMHTYSKDRIFTGCGGGGGGNGPKQNIIYMFIMLSGVFISSKLERKNKE
jgi:hypothetical protein